MVVASLFGVAALRPTGDREQRPTGEAAPGQTSRLADATLLEVREVTGSEDALLAPGAVMVAITARIADSGETVTFETVDDSGSVYAAGQRVRLSVIEQPGQPPLYYVSDFQRAPALMVLLALFLTTVVGFGRWQGARALLGLTFTFGLISLFVVPAILDGRSPLAVAIVGSILVMVATLYLSHGLNAKSTAAVVGTGMALLITGLLAVAFVEAASLTGFSSEEARLANVEVGGLSLRGLLLAGIIVGGLGVLDDVTMAQSSTVFELHRANPTAGFSSLLRGALRVGRDHVAATVNTLFLAYAGASLPLLLLFATGNDPFATVATSEVVAVEIVRALVGSIGLIAAVPLTTALAAALVGGTSSVRSPGPRVPSTAETMPPASGRGDPGENDPEWVTRLRDAYRLPPGKE